MPSKISSLSISDLVSDNNKTSRASFMKSHDGDYRFSTAIKVKVRKDTEGGEKVFLSRGSPVKRLVFWARETFMGKSGQERNNRAIRDVVLEALRARYQDANFGEAAYDTINWVKAYNLSKSHKDTHLLHGHDAERKERDAIIEAFDTKPLYLREIKDLMRVATHNREQIVKLASEHFDSVVENITTLQKILLSPETPEIQKKFQDGYTALFNALRMTPAQQKEGHRLGYKQKDMFLEHLRQGFSYFSLQPGVQQGTVSFQKAFTEEVIQGIISRVLNNTPSDAKWLEQFYTPGVDVEDMRKEISSNSRRFHAPAVDNVKEVSIGDRLAEPLQTSQSIRDYLKVLLSKDNIKEFLEENLDFEGNSELLNSYMKRKRVKFALGHAKRELKKQGLEMHRTLGKEDTEGRKEEVRKALVDGFLAAAVKSGTEIKVLNVLDRTKKATGRLYHTAQVSKPLSSIQQERRQQNLETFKNLLQQEISAGTKCSDHLNVFEARLREAILTETKESVQNQIMEDKEARLLSKEEIETLFFSTLFQTGDSKEKSLGKR